MKEQEAEWKFLQFFTRQRCCVDTARLRGKAIKNSCAASRWAELLYREREQKRKKGRGRGERREGTTAEPLNEYNQPQAQTTIDDYPPKPSVERLDRPLQAESFSVFIVSRKHSNLTGQSADPSPRTHHSLPIYADCTKKKPLT